MTNGSTKHFLMLLYIFYIKHQSIASVEYGLNGKEDKIAIELNVNININGSKIKEIAPGIAEEGKLKIKARASNDCIWGKWGQCSESCGYGFRERVLLNADSASCKENFVGLPKQTEKCRIRNNNCEPISELTCVPGYSLLSPNWKSYLSSWHAEISAGESTSNRDECWRLAQQNVGNANGIYWSFDIGYCRALVHYQKVLPWPTSFPDHQNVTKLCLKTELVASKVRSSLDDISDDIFEEPNEVWKEEEINSE